MKNPQSDIESSENENNSLNFQSTQQQVGSSGNIYIAGIGASAGGLEALEVFLKNMPSESGLALVIIHHLSADYKSYMQELLSRYTKMSVVQIEDNLTVMPNCIYLNPPKFYVTISKGKFKLSDPDPSHKLNLSIDTFFFSLAKEQQEKSIGIILSGTGSDGTIGCRAIKEAGGIIMVQDEETAKFNGMPGSVISTAVYDYILPPDRMPCEISKYIEVTSIMDIKEYNVPKFFKKEDLLGQIYAVLKKHYLIDFAFYKQSTILRRIERRMRITQKPDLNHYVAYIHDNNEEIELLYNSFLIGVTRFFRDADAFEKIKEIILPTIFKNKNSDSTIRVWVAGCSTGEEAYSLAILFKEYMEYNDIKINVKIFATDIDNYALRYASTGVYPESIYEDVSSERLSRYFIKKMDSYQIAKSIREMIVFSYHNVINNPPFYKLDFLSCRNLLIYFEKSLQKRIVSTFQFALEAKGFLFLGASETLGELGGYFSVVDSKCKIFKCRETEERPLINDISIVSIGAKVIETDGPEDSFTKKMRTSWELEEIYFKLIEECISPGVIIDQNGEIVQICGDANKYLKVPTDKVSLNILRMVPKEITATLGTAISKVKRENKAVTYANIRLTHKDGSQYINLIVRPFPTEKNLSLIHVIFDEIEGMRNNSGDIEKIDMEKKLNERITDLEHELQYTKESLQTAIEEIETSVEELQCANEELLVSNEELKNTNEELKSVNEELLKLNSQYQQKIQELADANNDMANFINSNNMGTIFLDTDLCIRRFTPAATKEINLMDQDIGRPISHISHNLGNEDLIKDSMEVLSSLIPREIEVHSCNDNWYILKISPYRVGLNSINGIVLSLIDITQRKKAEAELIKSKLLYEQLVENSPYGIYVVLNKKIVFSNSAGENLINLYKYNETLEKIIINHSYMNYSEINYDSPEKTNRFQEDKLISNDGSEIFVELISIPISFEGQNAMLTLVSDITSRKKEGLLVKENEKSKSLLDEAIEYDKLKTEFFSNLSHELKTPLNVILSALQLMNLILQEKNFGDEGKKLSKYSNVMKQNCYRQLRLVTNMIDITKMDSGFFDLKLKNYNIVNIVENVISSVSEYIEKKSIALIFDTDVEEKITACDPDKIERIMLNLLSNAVKFTNPGGVINVNIYDKGENIIISVKDSGTGIPKDKLEIIFDRFRQVDKSLARNHEGSGIGLSIVKSLVELHSGKISVFSEYGKGTEFVINIPINKRTDDVVVFENNDDIFQERIERVTVEFSDIYS